MERAGYLEQYDTRRRRQQARAHHAQGKRLLNAVEEISRQLESDWAQAMGGRELSRLRSHLTRALCTLHGGSLLPVRPTSS